MKESPSPEADVRNVAQKIKSESDRKRLRAQLKSNLLSLINPKIPTKQVDRLLRVQRIMVRKMASHWMDITRFCRYTWLHS
jgi:hypothetical protein